MTQRLNRTLTVADVDQIKRLCAAGLSDEQIIEWFRENRNRALTIEEVQGVTAMLAKEHRAYAIRRYTAGIPPLEIARQLGVTQGCIHMLAKRAGLPRQRPRLPPKPALTPAAERAMERQKRRNREMRALAASKRAAGCSTKALTGQANYEDLMARLALIPDDTRTTTGRICGDPLPGRSALDQRQGPEA